MRSCYTISVGQHSERTMFVILTIVYNNLYDCTWCGIIFKFSTLKQHI